MSAFKNDDDFNERLSTAARAKQALLEKFRARPKADDPAAAERQAARLATSLARDARIAERKAAREAEAARLQAEAIRQAAEDAARTKRKVHKCPALSEAKRCDRSYLVFVRIKSRMRATFDPRSNVPRPAGAGFH